MKPALLVFAVLAACAPAPVHGPEDSVVPGTIGLAVREHESRVVVAAVGQGSPARVGDVVLRYNGEAIGSTRQFYRLVADSAPGSMARLEVLRDGAPRTLEMPVEQLDLTPRV